ncbi:hypothetical protein HDV06_000122 [Boothiomyces sp. JEL0866]|nr:hypothetical protein HDV06_000122 [Boothiomyces sp. JEL0866]
MKRKHSRIILFLALIFITLFTFNQITVFRLTQEEANSLKYNIAAELPDFPALSRALRTFKTIHDEIFTRTLGISGLLYFYDSHAENIDAHLFPWLKTFPNTIRLRKSFKGTGIVMSVNDRYTDLAVSTLLMIRNIHKCQLPVEIFYIGKDDLSVENQDRFKAIPNTQTIDITEIFDNDILQMEGWGSKPFALLASSFRNAMIIDADTVFLQSPELLFTNRLYLDHGALFFQDRTVYSLLLFQKFWMELLFPFGMSEYAQNTRMMLGDTAHQQESGVVLIDKTRRLPGLLAACMLNAGHIKEKTYENVHGDKETFWLGFEIMGENYIFNPYLVGTLGKKEICQRDYCLFEVCSAQILHTTEEGPMWINGGIIDDKFNSTNVHVINPTHYVLEPGEWSFSHEIRNQACLLTNSTPKALPNPIRQVIIDSGEIWIKNAEAQ